MERLQPKPTAHHRRPQIHVPEELATSSHVFVLRGGVQPTLTAPYDGPYRVLQRGPNGFRVHFPGKGSDIVALARLKPAFVNRDAAANDNNSDQELDDEEPPSPPPPGRRPGPRTRQPQPTTRVTRSQRRDNFTQQPSTSSDANEPTCARSSSHSRRVTRLRSPSPDSSQESVPAPPRSPSPPPIIVREPLTRAAASLPAAPPAPPQLQNADIQTQQQGGAKRTLSFSKPKPGNFSYRRRRQVG